MARSFIRFVIMSAALAASAGTAAADDIARWRFWGGGPDNNRNAAQETRLSPDTVSRLAVKWSYRADGDISATPTIEGDDLYLTDWGGGVHKLNRHTGALVWKRSVAEFTGDNRSLSRTSPAIGSSVIVIGDYASSQVLALDKATGNLAWKVALDPDPSGRMTSSPMIHRGRVYAGVSTSAEFVFAPAEPSRFRGSVVALDPADGHTLWHFRTVPPGYGGGAVWGSTPVPDAKRGSLYVTTGNNVSLPESVKACVEAARTDPDEARCLSPFNHYDSTLALDLETGALKWAKRLTAGADAWIVGCLLGLPSCPAKGSPDFDIGSGVNLITTTIDGVTRQLVGVGQKSGQYWALDPDTGEVVWVRQVGPGSFGGGIQWGSASDGRRVYVAISNSARKPYFLAGDPERKWRAGSFAALDAATGAFVWQVPQPEIGFIKLVNSSRSPPMTVANGVVYAGSFDGTMAALDAATGETLWMFRSGGTVMSGPSIVDGMVYWGSGYTIKGGTGSRILWAFGLP